MQTREQHTPIHARANTATKPVCLDAFSCLLLLLEDADIMFQLLAVVVFLVSGVAVTPQEGS